MAAHQRRRSSRGQGRGLTRAVAERLWPAPCRLRRSAISSSRRYLGAGATRRRAATKRPCVWLTVFPFEPGTRSPGAASAMWLAGLRRGDAAASERPRRCSTPRPAAPDGETPSEPLLACDALPRCPKSAPLWWWNSLSVRQIHLPTPPRGDVRVLASRGASGTPGPQCQPGRRRRTRRPAQARSRSRCSARWAFLDDAAALATGAGAASASTCAWSAGGRTTAAGTLQTLESRAGRPSPGALQRTSGTPHGASLEHLAAAFAAP